MRLKGVAPMTAMRRGLTGAIAVAAAIFFLGTSPAYTKDETDKPATAAELAAEAAARSNADALLQSQIDAEAVAREAADAAEAADRSDADAAEAAAREAADASLQDQITAIEGIGDIGVCVAGDVLVFNGTDFKCAPIDALTAVKTVFTTSASFTGNLGGLDGADSLCQQAADTTTAIVPEGEYVAFLSTSASEVHARDRLSPNYGGYVLPDGTTMIAASKADLLDGEILHSIDQDEFGDSIGGVWVWTGSGNDGRITSVVRTCDDWESDVWPPPPYGARGHTGLLGWPFPLTKWAGGYYTNCDPPSHLYCFQQ
jgi:hypothetical protein